MTKRIALTGATGFVGGHLLRLLLSRGYKINALTRVMQEQIENVNWVKGDLENKDALKELVKDAHVIINVAGLVKAQNKKDFSRANSDAISNILTSIDKEKTAPHFIQISSLAAREPQLSDYAFSKNEGEKVLINNEIGINWTIIRPPGIYGPNDQETLKIFKLIKWRLALYPGNKHHRVSWIHVTDLVNAISRIVEKDQQYGTIIEIDDGNKGGYTHAEFFDTIAKNLNINPIKITAPNFLLKIIGHINDIMGAILGYAPMLSSKKVNEICHPDWVCRDTHKFQDDEWHAKYNLTEGLKETLDWYKNNKSI
ncbi:MAG: NAD(P)-dependent oxidoreductase [Kordiimonadaceae bacterium]|jgi:2-alkyl-3-oxoalkanoate reductase|nr:NAD(P)-dependent oxidoreductase [Kordiimonadaceae bacterium]MBT6035822.1 NAD(P)-dependent oxidoreductase [Kordiimonadaceae bacterium]MBT6330404.1 NAD(P)-dependent oxidoreductase [Kordiimonadaceae bacterium]MBT7581512.1 NAD(P)-dependent oxidoreductase [Kordiimonadaceae bacterium]